MEAAAILFRLDLFQSNAGLLVAPLRRRGQRAVADRRLNRPPGGLGGSLKCCKIRSERLPLRERRDRLAVLVVNQVGLQKRARHFVRCGPLVFVGFELARKADVRRLRRHAAFFRLLRTDEVVIHLRIASETDEREQLALGAAAAIDVQLLPEAGHDRDPRNRDFRFVEDLHAVRDVLRHDALLCPALALAQVREIKIVR